MGSPATHLQPLALLLLLVAPTPSRSAAVATQVQLKESSGAACEAKGGRVGVCRAAAGCPVARSAPLAQQMAPLCSGAAPVCCLSDSKADRVCQKYTKEVYMKGKPKRKQRAVGGVPAKSCEFPHMALIGMGGGREKPLWECGGSLISDRFVLTAAHCLNTSTGVARWVRLGALNSRNDSRVKQFQDFPVAERIPHPKYKWYAHYNDIGLLRLDGPVRFSHAIRPACLQAQRLFPQAKAVATGWGATRPLSGASEHLMKVRLEVQKIAICEQAYSGDQKSSNLRSGFKEDSMICAGKLEGGSDTCEGDSGGPLQMGLKDIKPCVFRIVGITSFGKLLCGFPNAPSVYTRVSHYIPWIESIVWRNEN